MIKSFGDKETGKIWDGIRSRKLPNEIQNIARRKPSRTVIGSSLALEQLQNNKKPITQTPTAVSRK